MVGLITLSRNHRAAMEFARRDTGAVVIHPDALDSMRFNFEGAAIRVSDVAHTLTEMVNEYQRLVDKLFMDVDRRSSEFQLPGHIYDDWGATESGYNFTSDQRNSIDTHSLVRPLYRRLGHLTEEGRYVFDQAACALWRDTYAALITLEAAICHLNGGLPPHGTEQVESTFTATPGRERTLRVANNRQLCDVGSYHKTIQVSGGEDLYL